MLLSQKFSNNMLPLYIMTKYRKKGGKKKGGFEQSSVSANPLPHIDTGFIKSSPIKQTSSPDRPTMTTEEKKELMKKLNKKSDQMREKLIAKLETKEITIGDIKKNVPMMHEAMSNTIKAMSYLLQEMKNSKKSTEKKFAESIIANTRGEKNVLSKFLTIEEDGKIKAIEPIPEQSDMQGGNGDDDTTALACQSICSNLTALDHARQGAVSLQQQLLQAQQDGASIERITQIQNSLLIANETFARAEARAQLINALNSQQNWSRCRDVCNVASKFLFTGLSGFTAIMILRLVRGAAGFITGTASGVVSLISVGILNIISGGVNTITENIPYVGRRVMGDGRAILNNFTSSVGEELENIEEINNFMTGLEELGYTSQIIAFLILFVIFMILFHLTRIVASADSVSVSVPLVGGINVGNQGTGGQLLTTDQLAMLQNCPGGTVQPVQSLENTAQQQMLTNQNSEDQGGGKKRRRRKRKTKRKTKKRKRHRRKKKKSTRKR
jgi:hypothetical protein